MRLVLHPKVYSDIDEIMGYYERVATPWCFPKDYHQGSNLRKIAESKL